MLIDLIKANRSYRRFDGSHPVSRAEVLDLLEACRFVASSTNKQPFKYYISCEAETNASIFSLLKFAALLKDWNGPEENERPTAYVVICADTDVVKVPDRFDCGVIAQTLLLGCAERGLGGCMVGNFNREKLKDTLGLGTQFDPYIVIAIGKPSETVLLENYSDSTNYYRDSESRHHVPKRLLKQLLINP
jgi:nitroreductase